MRKQRAFAKLTPAEVDQIAEWLRSGIYEDVLERIAKPRPEGFGLKISVRPLQLLREKRERVDNINKRIKEGKPLSLAEFDAIQAGERQNVTDEVHRAIMDSTHELATSGENTPTDLLKLQTLADFETRSELRAQKAELELRRDQRATETAAHRKEMDGKRLALAERALQLRERIADAKLTEASKPHSQPGAPQHASQFSTSNSQPKEDALGRLARNLDDVERRACEKFNLPYHGPSAETSQSSDSSEPDSTDATEPQSSCSSSSETSSETSTNEPLTNTGLQSGEPEIADTPTASAVFPDPLPLESTPENQDEPQADSSTDPLKCKIETAHCSLLNDSQSTPLPPVERCENSEPSRSSVASAKVDAPKNSALPTLPSALGLEPSALVKSHAIRRWRAHIPRPPGTPEPDGSWREECPCGHPLPCPEHGEMPNRAKWYRPQHPEYKHLLEEAGVPYYIPTPEEIGCTKEELDRSLDQFAHNPQIQSPPDPKFACLFQPGANPYVWPGGTPLP